MAIQFQPILEGKCIQLRVLQREDQNALKKIALNDSIWTFNRPLTMPIEDYLTQYFDQMIQGHLAKDPFAYVVVLKETQQLIGSTRYYYHSEQDRRLCIGFTWYVPDYWGTTVNPESKYLLLSQAFERLGMNRVEFHVDSRNRRSISAMLSLGATLECVMKQHKIVQDNYVRDTALFSILKADWPGIRAKLLLRLQSL